MSKLLCFFGFHNWQNFGAEHSAIVGLRVYYFQWRRCRECKCERIQKRTWSPL